MSLKSLFPYLLIAAGGAYFISEAGWFSASRESGISAIGRMDERPDAAEFTPIANTPAADNPSSGSQPTVDESAIYYYASQGDRARMEAEISRLKALYPNWTPPTNPERGRPAVVDTDLQQMWTLFAEGRFPAVRDAIARREQREPAWTPPEDLLSKLDEAEARLRLVNAGEAKQWQTVLEIAAEEPQMLICGNMDVLWTVAEAFAETGNVTRARDAFTYILTNCDNKAERAVTAGKAAALLPVNDAEALLAAHGGEEFDAAREALIRRRIGAATQSRKPASGADIAWLERVVAADTAAVDDVNLLAFYIYGNDDAARAAPLFKRSLDHTPDSKTAEGYVLALHAQGKYLEAEPIAYSWHDKGPDNLKAYLTTLTSLLTQTPPPRLDEAIVRRFAPVVMQEQSASAAQALGWYAYNTGQIDIAELWFIQALRWDRENEPAAYGLAITLERQKKQAAFMAVVNAWYAKSQRIADLVNPRARRTAAAATMPAEITPPGTFEESVRRPAIPDTSSPTWYPEFAEPPAPAAGQAPARSSGAREAAPRAATSRGCASGSSINTVSRLSSQSALALGWCLMDIKRPMEAVRAFTAARDKAANSRIRTEAAYGLSLSYLQAGLTNDAAIAATEARATPRQKRELRAALLDQQAVAAFQHQRYAETIYALDARSQFAPEQTDLMTLRGWSYFHLGRFAEAERIFKALQRAGASTDGAKGLNAIAERLNRIRY